MTKTKSTKRALLLSALSLLMCVSMLIGSTFAWFTDSVTSAGNIIQSGTLDVDLVDANGNSMEGKVIEFKTADGRAQSEILWEPGCTYETNPVYVVNKGNLALKYNIVINGIEGDAKLLEAIEWTITVGNVSTEAANLNGELLAGEKTEAIVLSGHMKEEAGNEYQDLTVEGISIAVYATQYTYEKDSFNDQYDKGAAWDGTIPATKPDSLVVDTAAKLISINDPAAFAYLNTLINDANFAAAYGSKWKYSIELNCDVNLLGKEWTPIVMSNFVGFDGNGHTISNLRVTSGKDKVGLFASAGGNDLSKYHIKDLTIDGAYIVGGNQAGALVGYGNCIVENVTVLNATVEAGKYIGGLAGRVSGVKNSTIKNSTVVATDKTVGGLVGYCIADPGIGSAIGNTVENVTVTGAYNVGGMLGQAQNVTVDGNTVKNVTVTSTKALPADASSNEVRAAKLAARSAFDNTTIGANTVENVTCVAEVSSAASLGAALAEGGKVVLTADITADNVVTLANIPAGVSATLDLNGHDITASLNGSAGWSQIFRVGKGATLTVNGEGNVHAVSYPTTSYGSVIFNNDAGTLVINGGTYTMDYGTYAEGYLLPSIVDTNSNVGKATTTINGGTFYHNRNMFRNFAQPQRGENNATLIINGGTFNGEADDYASIWNQKTNGNGVVGDGVVELNGGTFNYVDITNDFQDNTCIKIDASITNVTINH